MRNFRLGTCVLILPALAACDILLGQGTVERPAVPRVGAWRSIGPEGATVLGFASDPSRPGTVFALTPGRVFRSIDCGVTWGNDRSVPGRFGTGIAVSPGEEPVLFVTDSYEGLLRSQDGGKSWKAFELGGDIGEAVTVDPSAPDRVWAAVSDGIWRSTDQGETWEGTSLIGGRTVLVDRTDGDRVFAGTFLGLFRSLDSGATWQNVSAYAGAIGLAQDPTNPGVFFAWGQDAIRKSADSGDSWVTINTPLGVIKGFAVDTNNVLYATTVTGLHLSHDGGSTWIPAVTESGPGAELLADMSRPDTVYASVGPSVVRTQDGGATFASSRRGLVNPGLSGVGLDPKDPNHLLVGAILNQDLASTYSSRDGGLTWTESHTGHVDRFAVDPEDPERVYGAGSAGAFRSDDGGATWTRSSEGLSFAPTSLLMDPLDSATLYVGTCCGPSGTGGGVYKSSDSGATWHQTFFGPDPPVDQLWWVISLAADVQTGILYAASRGGLKRSTNHGGSWTDLGFSRTSFVAVDPLAPQTLYVIEGGLFRSTDGGASWIQLESATVTSLLPSPSASGVLYATTTDRGVLRSDDSGETWESWNDGIRDACIVSLAIDAAGETLVAGTCSNGLYVRTIHPARDTRRLTRPPA